MVGPRGIAPRHVDGELDGIAHLDRPGLDQSDMRVQPSERLGRVADRDAQALICGDRPGIAHLAAAFTVERRLVGQHGHCLARMGFADFLAVPDQRDHHALAHIGSVAGKLGRAFAFGNIEPHFAVGGLAGALPRRARCGLLLRHCGFEACPVDRYAARAQRVLGQVIGEAERVIELERRLAGQAVARAQIARFLVEQAQAVRQSAAELHFLAQQGFLDQRLRAAQLRESLPHLGNERAHQPVHQRLFCAEQMRVAHRAAHDPA